MNFDGPEMIEIGGETYIYYRDNGNNTYRARLVAGSAETAGVVVQNADISPSLRYVYELGTESMNDSARFNAEVAASYNIDLTAVGAGDPAPHFYAASGNRDAYLEFRFDFSKTDYRATRASVRDILAMFKISDYAPNATAVTEWSTDEVTWHTIRELESPEWRGQPVGATSQGTTDLVVAGEHGLCEELFYRVYFSGDDEFGWNWNQWNRDSDNQFRVACDVVPDDYVSICSDLLLGRDWGAVALVDAAESVWHRTDSNAGHLEITGADLEHDFTVLLEFLGPQGEIDELINELLAKPAGTEYVSATTGDPALDLYGHDIALRFDAPLTSTFTFNWHFAGHPDVRLWEIRIVPEPHVWVLIGLGLLGGLLRRREKG